MFTLVVSIFVVETFIMVALEGVEPAGWKETLADSSLLTATLYAILYFILFKPLVVLIESYRHKEIELKTHQQHLEQLIQECAVSEAALRETKAILQAAMDQSPTGIAIADAPDGALRYVNDVGLLMRGIDRQEFVNGVGYDQFVSDLQILDFDGHLVKPTEGPLGRALQFGETGGVEYVVRGLDNDERIVQFNAAPIRKETNEIVAAIAIFWDITERKRVEEELKVYQNHLEQLVQERSRELQETSLRLKKENEGHIKAKQALQESEERFRQIFEQSEDAIILISPPDNEIIDVNPTAERIFRKNKEDLLGHNLSSLCDQQGHHQLECALEQIILDNFPGLIEKFECLLPPGDIHILSFHGKKIRLQGSEVIYTTFRDITTRIILEEQAREIQARLIQANRMTSLGTMVSSVAHEINNPNNFLLMNAGIVKRSWEDIAPVVEDYFQRNGDFAVAQSLWSEARSFFPEAIDGIQQGALRISEIVGNLKAYGRDNRFQAESQADVNAVVQLSTSILNHHINRATHRFRLELAEDLPQVRGSARQLEQVVINLIQNALQALPSPDCGVTVSTGTDPVSGHVLIRISDEGTGVPPEIANRIMEPFFTTRLEHGGTGLGLAISATIVKEHDGSIEFESEQDKGSTFTVRLCRAAVPEITNDQRGTP
ncbi:MAG: PAS domain S-box protein [Desulfuromonadales bacterium]|nr:PAS domain S-box protein [Desulfuromonadales bacterium]